MVVNKAFIHSFIHLLIKLWHAVNHSSSQQQMLLFQIF